MQHTFKRFISGLLAVVVFVTVLNLADLSKINAFTNNEETTQQSYNEQNEQKEDVTGLKINVEYSQNNTQATLKGDFTNVRQDISIMNITDDDGVLYSDSELSKDVTENGEYTFKVQYSDVTDNSQEPVFKEEEIVVVVDKIKDITEQQPSNDDEQVDNQENQQSPKQGNKSKDKPNVDKSEDKSSADKSEDVSNVDNSDADTYTSYDGEDTEIVPAPITGETIPYDELVKNAEKSLLSDTKAATVTLGLYAYENGAKLGEHKDFAGGDFGPEVPTNPDSTNRQFKEATYKIKGEPTEFEISGIYIYNNNWYYTIPIPKEEADKYPGQEYIGVKFNDINNVEFKIYYELKVELPNHTVTNKLNADYNLRLDNQELKPDNSKNIKQGKKVLFEFDATTRYESTIIKIRNANDKNTVYETFDTTQAEPVGTPIGSTTKLVKTADRKFAGFFKVPEANVEIIAEEKGWSGGGSLLNVAIRTNDPDNVETDNQQGQSLIEVRSGADAHMAYSHDYTEGRNTPDRKGKVQDTSFGGSGQNLFTKTREGKYEKKEYRGTTFNVGSTIKIRSNVTKGTTDYSGNIRYAFYPVMYSFDFYNDNNLNGYNFKTYKIMAPREVTEEPISQTLDNGVVITIKCVNSVLKKPYSPDSDVKLEHEIEVKNARQSFNVQMITANSNQTNNYVHTMDGVKSGKLNNKYDNGIEGSYMNLALGQELPRVDIPMDLGTDFIWAEGVNENKPGLNHEVDFYVEPEYGYTKPTAEQEIVGLKLDQTTSALGGGSLWTQQVDVGNGKKETRYYYWFYKYTNGKIPTDSDGIKGGEQYPMRIHFKSKPVQLDVQYWYNNAKYADGNKDDSGKAVPLKVVDDNYYQIENLIPKEIDNNNKYLKGYYIDILDNQGNTIKDGNGKDILKDIENPNAQTDDKKLWLSGDALNIRTQVYDVLRSSNVPNFTNEKWQIRLKALDDTKPGKGSTVDSKVQLYEQKAGGVDKNIPGDFNNQKFAITDKAFLAHARMPVSVKTDGALDSQIEKGNKKYKRVDNRSILTGTMKDDGTINDAGDYLRVVYSSAATVKFEDLGTSDGTASWPGKDKWYTSVNNFDHTIDTNGINPGTKQNMNFKGWKVKIGTDKYSELFKPGASINLYMLTNGKDEADDGISGGTAEETAAWEYLFNGNGEITLQAQWEDPTKPVYSVVDQKTNKANTTITHTDENHKVLNTGYDDDNDPETPPKITVTAEFQYGDGTAPVTQDELDKLVKIVLLKKDPPKKGKAFNESPTALWFDGNEITNSGNNKITKPTITAKDNPNSTPGEYGKFDVTFTVTDDFSGEWYDGAILKIYAYTSKNETTGKPLPDGTELLNDYKGKTLAGQDSAYKTSIPAETIRIYIRDKMTTIDKEDYSNIVKKAPSRSKRSEEQSRDSKAVDWSEDTITVNIGQSDFNIKGFFGYNPHRNRYNYTESPGYDMNKLTRGDDVLLASTFTPDVMEYLLGKEITKPDGSKIPHGKVDNQVKYEVWKTPITNGKAGTPEKVTPTNSKLTGGVLPTQNTNPKNKNGTGAVHYDLTLTSPTDSAKYTVYMGTEANGTRTGDETAPPTDWASKEFTVNVIKNPNVFVSIPESVILEDGKSNITEQGLDPKDYAGRDVTVSYKTETDDGKPITNPPKINVKVHDNVLLTESSNQRAEQGNMTIGIYNKDGKKLPTDKDYCDIGTLGDTITPKAITFWMNTKRGNSRNEQFTATVDFLLSIATTK